MNLIESRQKITFKLNNLGEISRNYPINLIKQEEISENVKKTEIPREDRINNSGTRLLNKFQILPSKTKNLKLNVKNWMIS